MSRNSIAFWLASAGLFLCSFATTPTGSAQTPTPKQLTLIQPGDPSFDSLVAANFAGLSGLDGYAFYRPFLVLLRNSTSHAARAYMIQWETRSNTGEARQLADFVERYDPGLASERVALAPGELRLVSDHFDVGPKEFQSTRDHNWVAAMLSGVQKKNRYSAIDPTSITASIDAVIFDDDTCAGPDHYHICQRLQTEMDAEQDVAGELLQLLDKKATEADVLAYLKGQTSGSGTATASLSGADFDHAFWRGRQAEKLLTLYKRGGLENVMQRAWKVQQHPRKKLSPVSAN